MIRKLPTVRYQEKEYFMDNRLKEFRSVEPPIEFIPFGSDLGKQIKAIWDASWDDRQIDGAIEDLKNGDAVIIECPMCGKDTFIGYGQGYTSDNRQYPIGTCCCCDMNLKALDDETDVELMMEFRGRFWDKWVLFCLEQGYEAVIR